MKFVIDAQLPRRLTYRLREVGHDALHTLDLPNGNRTSDAEITALSVREERVLITKDADFVASFVLTHQPSKLLLISTGNIKNSDLEALFVAEFPAIISAFADHDFLEVTRSTLTVRV